MFVKAKSQQLCEKSNPGPLAEIPATLTPVLAVLMQIILKLKYQSYTQPGGW